MGDERLGKRFSQRGVFNKRSEEVAGEKGGLSRAGKRFLPPFFPQA